MSYIMPQVQVFQEFKTLPTAVIENLNAFVFGPNYKLFRYAIAAEKALISLGAYDKDSDNDYVYPAQPAGSIIDQDYVKLYMESIWAEYLTIAASATHPLNVVGPSERNKLRAAPVIGEAKEGQSAGPTPIAGVDMDSSGYFIGNVALPEDYYFYAQGGETNDWKTDISTSSGEDAVLAYKTSEGLSGTVSVLNANDPLGNNVLTAGPDGIQFDLDGGIDSELWSPMVVRFADAAGTSYFDLSLDYDAIKTIINWAVDDLIPISINIGPTTMPNSVDWDDVTRTLTIALNEITAYTLTALKEALDRDSDIATYFDTSAITGTGGGETETAVDQDSADVMSGHDIIVLRDCYRIRILPNPYTFKTANDYNRSAHFKNRDVKIGDRLRYSVTDDSLVVHTGETKIVGLEADKSIAAIGDPSVDVVNGASQSATDLVAAGDIVIPGSDNQRDFDGINTTLVALDAVNIQYPGELISGIIADTFTVTITKAGVAGIAEATVTNASGTYSRENVLIEAVGADDGKIYLGNNLCINFDAGAAEDGVFQAADTYTFSADVNAAYTAVAGTLLVASAGTYIGTSNTTYKVEVIRGGVFDRAVNVINGLQQPAAAVLSVTVSDAAWTGGDINDEYVLKCKTAGSLTTAEFILSSQLGDSQTTVQFAGIATDVDLGGKGMTGQFDAEDAFDIGDYWVIKVNAARPQVRITDTAGIDNGGTLTVNDTVAVALGSLGATLTFAANTNTEDGFCANGGLLKGDIFYVAVTAEADAAIKTLVLADDLSSDIMAGEKADGTTNGVPNNVSVWLYLLQTSAAITTKKVQSSPDYNWQADSDSINVKQDIAVQDASWYEDDGSLPYLTVYKADMYAEYRALLTALSDTIHFISDINDVATDIGTITPDAVLAQGVYNALANSGDRDVYYMAVPTDDAAGYDKVLAAATLSDDVYGLAPLTRNASILATVEAHVNAMSTETDKRWRFGFVGTEMATNVVVYNKAKNAYSEEYFATIKDNPSVAGNQYTLVEFWRADGVTPAPTEILSDVVAGDKIRINFATDAWGDATYTTYIVASLVSNTSLKLTAGPDAAISVAEKAEVWHDYTIAEMATAVAAESAAFANRRMAHIFPGSLGAYGVTQTSEFAAAAVAGLCSSVPPQQGLTNIELNGFDDLPMVYSVFNKAQLDTMAENGTLIIMQDTAGGVIYIRHQVTTAAASGNLNTTELSVTKNLDSISYYFAERLQPYIGKYNITPELLDVLDTQMADGLMYLGSRTSIGLLGPQILLDNTEILSIAAHPVLKDHVIINLNVQLPYPLNVLELHIVV